MSVYAEPCNAPPPPLPLPRSKEVCAELWPFFHTYVRQRLELATVGWSSVPLKLPKSEREAIRELLETIHRCFGGVPAAVVKANPAFYCVFSPAKDHQTELQASRLLLFPRHLFRKRLEFVHRAIVPVPHLSRATVSPPVSKCSWGTRM